MQYDVSQMSKADRRAIVLLTSRLDEVYIILAENPTVIVTEMRAQAIFTKLFGKITAQLNWAQIAAWMDSERMNIVICDTPPTGSA